jgi:hypothetical protein
MGNLRPNVGWIFTESSKKGISEEEILKQRLRGKRTEMVRSSTLKVGSKSHGGEVLVTHRV